VIRSQHQEGSRIGLKAHRLDRPHNTNLERTRCARRSGSHVSLPLFKFHPIHKAFGMSSLEAVGHDLASQELIWEAYRAVV